MKKRDLIFYFCLGMVSLVVGLSQVMTFAIPFFVILGIHYVGWALAIVWTIAYCFAIGKIITFFQFETIAEEIYEEFIK